MKQHGIAPLAMNERASAAVPPASRAKQSFQTMLSAAVQEERSKSRAQAADDEKMRAQLQAESTHIAEDALADKHLLAAMCQWKGHPGACPTCVATLDPEDIAKRTTKAGSPANIAELHRSWRQRHIGLTQSCIEEAGNIKGFKAGACLSAGVCHCSGPSRMLGLFWSKLKGILLQHFKDDNKGLMNGYACLLLSGRRPEDGADAEWNHR